MLREKLFSATLLFLVTIQCGTLAIDCPDPNGPKIVCYYSSWAFYREGNGQFDVRSINGSLCTHYVYAFAGLDRDGKVYSLDKNVDITFEQYRNFTNLKRLNPCIKTMIAIGGWNEGSTKFSIMASTEQSRNAFVEDMLRFLAYYNFDGLDVDWEYPGERGGMKEDKENFVKLLINLKQRFKKWGFILSIAVPAQKRIIEDGYTMDAIANTVDFISIMAYDYTTATSPTTGLIAPFSQMKESVNVWLKNNVPPEKIILGFQAHARSFYLENPENHEIGAKTNGSLGPAGSYTQERGFLSFFEMETNLAGDFLEEVKSDGNYYGFSEKEWFSYDKVDTYTLKAQYAVEKNLGGVMLWSLDTDDFAGYNSIHYKVLKTIRRVILPEKN